MRKILRFYKKLNVIEKLILDLSLLSLIVYPTAYLLRKNILAAVVVVVVYILLTLARVAVVLVKGAKNV